MPDGQSIVVSGLSESGASRISTASPCLAASSSRSPATAIRTSTPARAPTAASIVFASDRTADGRGGAANLFLLDLSDPRHEPADLRRLARRVAPLGQGRPDLFHVRPRRRAQCLLRRFRRRGPSRDFGLDRRLRCGAAPGDGGLIVGGFHDLSWNLYRYPGRLLARARNASRGCPTPPPPRSGAGTHRGTPRPSIAARREPYRRRLTLDFAAGDAVVIPGYGGAQGIFFVASDLLGDNLLFGSVSSYQGRRLGSILSNLSATTVYLNQSRRVNWGVGCLPDQEPQLRGRPLRRLRRDRVRRHRAAALSAHPLHPDRGHRRRRALRPRRLHPSGRRAPPGRLDRLALLELRARQLALATERPDRWWPFRGHGGRVERLLQQPVRQLPRLGGLAPVSPARPTERVGAARLRVLQRRRSPAPRQHRRHARPPGLSPVRLHRRLRSLHVQPGAALSRCSPTSPSARRSAMSTSRRSRAACSPMSARPASPPPSTAHCLAAMALASGWRSARSTVLRLDVGRRFSSGGYEGYGLSSEQKKPGFVSFFFGYNY